MYPDSEILFPPRCIPLLAEVRGKAWKALVRRVARLHTVLAGCNFDVSGTIKHLYTSF